MHGIISDEDINRQDLQVNLSVSAAPGILEIKSVDVGVLAIRGLSSNHYLAIRKNGVLYGAVSIIFRHSLCHMYLLFFY